ncbi:hypothetical protein QYF61_023537 [Mycteria americana]|uniref:Uncharacterized protein n=1 Tax=Mycteria americana TaxID=33587 RepID=A0AAN7S9U4_MYCAM|nr:hypothetical protein QYF61_023537 [Mycteria americana]
MVPAQGTQARRDLLATALGGGGARLGVLNSMNVEVLANKLEVVTLGMQGLLNPLNSSLAILGMGSGSCQGCCPPGNK